MAKCLQLPVKISGYNCRHLIFFSRFKLIAIFFKRAYNFDSEAIISWNSFPKHLHSFTLGRGHRLKSTSLLHLIRTMPNLTHLDIFYDNFITSNVSFVCHLQR